MGVLFVALPEWVRSQPLSFPRKAAQNFSPQEAGLLDKAYGLFKAAVASGALRLESFKNHHSQWCSGGGQHLDIHTVSWFLPWHRVFILKQEQALRSVLTPGEASRLVLPYWNWDDPAHYKLPAIFINNSYPNLKLQRDEPTNPLPQNVLDLLPLANCFSKPQIRWNASGSLNYFHSLMKQLHDEVHLTVGHGFKDAKTAAFDPLFYAHHANVDRLWLNWRIANGDIADKELLQTAGSIFDFPKTLPTEPSIDLKDFLTPGRLPYSYSPPAGTPPHQREFTLQPVSYTQSSANSFQIFLPIWDLIFKSSPVLYVRLAGFSVPGSGPSRVELILLNGVRIRLGRIAVFGGGPAPVNHIFSLEPSDLSISFFRLRFLDLRIEVIDEATNRAVPIPNLQSLSFFIRFAKS